MFDATLLMRLYALARGRKLDRLDPIAAQAQELSRLLKRARHTSFGREHGFEAIHSVEDFQARVPLRRYEDFWHNYWSSAYPNLRDITWPGLNPYFAVTSGTTSGSSKNIPCSKEMIRSNRRAALDVLVHYLRGAPEARPLAGKTFMLGGSTALDRLAPGVWSGDLSAIATLTTPFWARGYTFPTPDMALIKNWDEKIRILSERALDESIRIVTGTPSWVLMVFEQMARLREGRNDPSPPFPDLELFIHGGVSFAPYRALFEPYLAATGATTREVYPASEGFIALQDRTPEDGLRLLADNGLFFEFVPVGELDSPAPTRHWLATAEPGVNYAIVLSSNAGLWAYILGDTVRLVRREPPRILITGRTSYMLSAFGEHLIGEEIERAVLAAADALSLQMRDFCVGPVFPQKGGTSGYHLYLVECSTRPDPSLAVRFSEIVDTSLRAQNDDYRVHREAAAGIAPPRTVFLRPGAFSDWMRARNRLGGQNKVPRVLNDAQKFDDLRRFMEGIS